MEREGKQMVPLKGCRGLTCAAVVSELASLVFDRVMVGLDNHGGPFQP